MTHMFGGMPSESSSIIYFYGYEDDPVCCPRCCFRSLFQELDAITLGMPEENGLQLHRCSSKGCGYVFLAVEM